MVTTPLPRVARDVSSVGSSYVDHEALEAQADAEVAAMNELIRHIFKKLSHSFNNGSLKT